jgi:hypothetical protein
MQASLTAAALAVALGFSGAAAAQPTFHYNAYGGFVSGSDSGFPDPIYEDQNTFDRNATNPNSLYNEFAWGDVADADKSRLTLNGSGLDNVIDDPQRHVNNTLEISNDINPSGDPEPGGSIFGYLSHDNNTIPNIFDGATVGVDYYLDIYETDAKDNRIATIGAPLQFELEVWETNNALASCPNGDPNPCDDRFRYRLVGAGGGFGEDFIDQTLGTFSHGGETYRVSSTGFFQEGGGIAGDFWTIEEQDVTTTGNVRIEAHAVPAPAPLGLLGLGLLGLAWLGGRRRPMAV